MTVPQWFGLLAVLCITARGVYGIVQVLDWCAERELLAELWDDEVAADDSGPDSGLSAVGGDVPPAWQPSLCVGRTGQVGGKPREWTLARTGPFDQDAA